MSKNMYFLFSNSLIVFATLRVLVLELAYSTNIFELFIIFALKEKSSKWN